MKYSPEFMIHEIVHLFSIILYTGIVPSEWSIGLICPIYKKGDIKNPGNYKGITLLSCLSKIYSSCINSRLSFYLEENNLIGETKAGFRSGYSTLNHIFTLHLLHILTFTQEGIYCIYRLLESVRFHRNIFTFLSHNIKLMANYLM